MSWLWGKKDDPLKDLDPTLREFLKKETPKEYKPESAKGDTSKSYREQLGIQEANQHPFHPTSTEEEIPEERPLPKESLFQDGRYKHLWKTYRSQAETEEAGKSDSEKLMDIVHGYKDRQAQIKRTAMESCSNEQWAVHECFRSGGWSSRMTMCKAENRQLERCMVMQARFLRALGYLGVYEKPQEEMDKIQMHADRLYHQMLDQEKAIEEAKAKGQEPPTFEPLIEEHKGGGAPGTVIEDAGKLKPIPGRVTWDALTPEKKQMIAAQRFAGLEGQALEVAKKALNQELAVNEVMARRLDDRFLTERKERLERLAEGRERISDKIKRWFDLRTYGEDGRPINRG